jgi:hypothetical protein
MEAYFIAISLGYHQVEHLEFHEELLVVYFSME